jgi:hypothetical protein
MFGVEHQGPLEDWRNVTYQSGYSGKQSIVANVGVIDNPRFRKEFDCVLNAVKRIATFVHECPAAVNGYNDQIADAISQLNAEKAARDAEAMKQAVEAAEAAAPAAGANQAAKVVAATAAVAAVSKVAEAADAAAAAGGGGGGGGAGSKRTRDSDVGGRGGGAKRGRGRPRKGA